MKIWDIPTTLHIRAIIDWAVQADRCDHVLLVAPLEADRKTYTSTGLSTTIEALFEGLEPASFLAHAWPGQRLSAHEHRVFVLELTPLLIGRMVTIGPVLQDWVDNGDAPLPEDICLFRTGARYPAIYSVTHHQEAWAISEQQPDLPGVQLSPDGDSDLMIPDGHWFCTTRQRSSGR